MTKYTWRCDRCGGRGAVRIKPQVDLWAGVQRILSAHRRTSGACQGGRDTIRLFTDETLTEMSARGVSRG